MFCKEIIEAGGEIFPLFVDPALTNGTGLCNPSIFVDSDKIFVNVRHVEYTLYHAEKEKYNHPWGPIQYLHPENDMHLRTNNYISVIDPNNFSQTNCIKVDTSLLDKQPIWTFVGLEDARIVKWDNKFFLCGVRRDTTTNGEGRMELSEIEITEGGYKEITRQRIPTPGNASSYCEKNWMPVLDMPYHFVKWCNPTQVVKYDPSTKTTSEVFLGNFISQPWDYRGGSQVLTYENYRFCLTHTCELYKNVNGRKNARYRHVFIVWDKDWNLIKYHAPFSFLNGEVEFSCGAALWQDQLLITFGFQDNSAYILKCPMEFIKKEFLHE
jgi:hypothetical protein